jgi:flagellar basal-body rod modification protein FlgD
MSNIDPVSSSTGGTQSAGKSAVPDRSILGKDDFLKLFAAQLQHQDPMSPMDNMQFMSQMAQFSTLEQVTNLGADIERLTFSNQIAQSVALIGHTVDYVDASGQAAQGVAQSVKFDDGTISVAINGDDVSPDHITGVR